MSKNALDRFSSKSFMISGFTYKSLSHFAFLFIYGVKKCSNLIVIHVAVQFSQNYLFKRLSFSIVYSYLLCHTLIGQRFLDLFLDSKFCTIDWFFCFCTSTSPFFFFFCYAHAMWKFPGQGSNLHQSSNLSCCSDNAISLSHCTKMELPIFFLIF